MDKRNRKVSVRTTEKIDTLIKKVQDRSQYRFYSKSDIVNMLLEEHLPAYLHDTDIAKTKNKESKNV